MPPLATASWMENVIKEQWGGKGLIQSWNAHWFHLPQRIAAKLAPMIGAQPDEVLLETALRLIFTNWPLLH